MRAADKFYKLNRQTPGPSIHAQKAYYRKISANSTEKKNIHTKSTQNRKSHYNFNAIRQSSISRKAASTGNPDDEMDFYPKTGHGE